MPKGQGVFRSADLMSPQLRHWVAEQLERSEDDLDAYTFQFEPEQRNLVFEHRVPPLMLMDGGDRIVEDDGIILDCIRVEVPQKFIEELSQNFRK